jgi:hypothetical protein
MKGSFFSGWHMREHDRLLIQGWVLNVAADVLVYAVIKKLFGKLTDLATREQGYDKN